MTAKYHVTPAGEAHLCRAQKGKCPFGGADAHYATASEAAGAYEHQQQAILFTSHRRNARPASRLKSKLLFVGTMGMLAVSTSGCMTIGNGAVPFESQDYSDKPSAAEEAQEIVNDALDEAIKEAQEAADSYEAPSITEGPDGPPVEASPITADTVYFQGKPLAPTSEEVQQARDTLSVLLVQPETNDGSYSREELYGRGFVTGLAGKLEHRDVPNSTFKNSEPQARVVSGMFVDPYTGEEVIVTGGDSADADIDHIVPLSEAYASEVEPLDATTRKALANDFENLQYTASSVNRGKGHKDAAEWLPSYEPAQCTYVLAQIHVKGKYNLSIDSAEKQAMQSVLDTRCN